MCWSMLKKLEQDCAACVCEKVLKKATNGKANLESVKKIQRQRVSVQSKRIWTTSNIEKEGRVDSPKTLAKTQDVRKKNKFEKPDSSNDSLVGSKESLGTEILQTAASSGHNGR